MNGTIKITGGVPLKGEVTPIPNKNAIVTVLQISILTDETVTYRNVPNTTDVHKILDILKKLGANVNDSDYSHLKINCKGVNSYKVDSKLGGQFRCSINFVGALLARFGIAEIPVPGGCVLGMRSISTHIDSFQKVGVKVEYIDGYIRFIAPKKLQKHYDIWQLEASVTATENLCIYVAGVDASFSIIDAASEPHVSSMLKLLDNMGAKVSGVGSNRISITGSKGLKGAEFMPGPDVVDIAGYIVAAAITDGEIRIKGGNVSNVVDGLINWFELFNIFVQRDGKDLIVSRKGDLYIDLKNARFPLAAPDLPKLTPRPWPGFPVDVLPIVVTLACKTKGKLLIQNWMYESGLDFTHELNKMGANIFMADPQRVIVHGPVRFNGGEIVSPSIIQACKAIFLAALCDPVETVIHGVDILKRRYPDIFEVYKGLGAKIKVLP